MEREKLIEYLNRGLNNSEIAREAGVSDTTVRKWLRRYGLKKNPTRFDPTPKPRRTCKLCGNLVDRPANRYCRQCLQKPESIQFQWLERTPYEEIKTDPRRKKKLLHERGHRCESCGLTEWQGKPIKLEMHHVDGDADNNSRENLQLLCPNCHSQTPTFRSKNRASLSRRKLYRKKYYET